MLVEKELRAEEEAVAGSALVDDVSLVVSGFHHRVVLQHNACTFVKATEYGKNLNWYFLARAQRNLMQPILRPYEAPFRSNTIVS